MPIPKAQQPLVQRTLRWVYFGLDPGKSGGIVVLASVPHGGYDARSYKMPETVHDLSSILQGTGVHASRIRAVVEKVGGYVKGGDDEAKGGGKANGSAMFSFGRGYGRLEGVMAALGISYEEVPPATWMKGLSIPGKKKNETKTVWKNRLKAKAQQLFPAYAKSMTLAVSDAFLIAEYCRRKHEGLL